MYLDRQAFSANNVDPDQMPQNVATDQGLHCLIFTFIQQFADKSKCSKPDQLKIYVEEWQAVKLSVYLGYVK